MGRARGTMDCWEGEKDVKIRLKKKSWESTYLKSKYLMLSFHEIISINVDAFVR